jgi:hypothetical protein
VREAETKDARWKHVGFCDSWRSSCVMDRSGVEVFLAVSVQDLINFRVCRACLRILICESERALGARIALRTLQVASNPQPNNRPLGWGRGMRGGVKRPSRRPRTNKAPLGNVLPYQSHKCSRALLLCVGRSSTCAFISTLVVTYVAQHSSHPLCSAFHHRIQPHPTNGPDQDTSNTSQIARHGT